MGKLSWKECKTLNICYRCNEPVFHAGYCESHYLCKIEYNKKRRKSVCDNCGGIREIAGYCKKCWDKRIKRRKKLEQIKKLNGVCVFCPNKTEDGKVRCKFCSQKLRKKIVEKESARIKQGLCIYCCKPCEGKAIKCNLCYAKQISKNHFGNVKKANKLICLLESQLFICPYTGNYLKLGDNASLDHIIPKSKGGSNNFSNLQWVYSGVFDVNWMKGDMDDKEFKKAILTIYNNIKDKDALLK